MSRVVASLSTSSAATPDVIPVRLAPIPKVLENLPPFPPVVGRLMALLANESSSLREAAKLIQTDAALSAQVLRLANSPLISVRFGASTILQAVSLVGVQRITGVVLTLALSSFLRRAGSGQAVRRCWRHNLASALVARHFANTFDVDSDVAYTAGLLHDIGRLVLIVSRPEVYERLVDVEGDIRQMEIDEFGMDHCVAGAWLIRKWNFPAVYAAVAEHHHDPAPEVNTMTASVNVACAVATQLGFSASGNQHFATSEVLDDDFADSIRATINLLECEYGM